MDFYMATGEDLPAEEVNTTEEFGREGLCRSTDGFLYGLGKICGQRKYDRGIPARGITRETGT